VPVEALATLRRRLAALPAHHPERAVLMTSTAQLYAVSRATLYRLLRGDRRPKDAHRTDRGYPRSMPAPEIERWCEIVAAMKVRTTNRKGRHLSTVRTLKLLVEYGVDTPDGFRKLDPGTLTVSTLNRHLRRLGYDHERVVRQAPAVRFQAERSNTLWPFNMSPSDLKQLKGFRQGSRHGCLGTGLGIGPSVMGEAAGMRCIGCWSQAIRERPERTAQGYRRFRCHSCGKQFNERTGTTLNRAQYPSDVIALVVLWRLRYKLSLRDLVEMFALRGVVFSHEASASGR
jgi:hypothetical protein